MLKNNSTLIALIIATAANMPVLAQTAARPEILTLFTTPQERNLIDNNRYRVSHQKTEATVKEAAPTKALQKKILMEDVILTIKLNGVSLNKEGRGIAWLNGKAYENGDKLDDGSSVYISGTLNAQVRIRTPDGKYHGLVTGDSSEIKYQKAAEG